MPKWRGAAPIQRSIMNLDKETGVSIMKISEKLDTGPVCNIYKINLENNLNAKDVSEKLSLIASEKILDNIHDEIPFNLKFVTDKILQNRDKSITVHITILLTKESYKPIILGKKGENIKKISMQARYDLENNLNKKFHLFIFLKVIKNKSLNYKAKV